MLHPYPSPRREAGRESARARRIVQAGTRTRLVAVLIGCATYGSPLAGQEPARAPDARAATAQEPVDEVVVRGRRLQALRKDVEAALDRAYELFNAANSDDDLDIHCSLEPRIGTHFKERVCRARYVDSATSRAGQEVVRSIQSNCPQGLASCPAEAVFDNATAIFQEEYEQLPMMDLRLRDEVQRLAGENAEFAASVAEYRAKERRYREAVEEASTRRRR